VYRLINRKHFKKPEIMYKLILILIITLLSNYQLDAKSTPAEIENKEEIVKWEYWNAFSEEFNKTADFWEAESAALEAEDTAKERLYVDKWLKEFGQDNLNS